MPYLLGLDTGGTYTDAALLFSEDITTHRPRLVSKSKSLTTRHDLSLGLGDATARVLHSADCSGEDIGLVSLSTTLATNALIEGQGSQVALIAIGFSVQDMERGGLSDALAQMGGESNDYIIHLSGGHTPSGQEAMPLDMSVLESCIDDLCTRVSGFAIVGYFAVRNPSHEERIRDFIHSRTDMAITCSHDLSSHLNGPKRALTTLLNARLVPLITSLITSAQSILSSHNISSPIMVVRGDGSLVSSQFASRRPIETILSGPAASLVGAHFLTDLSDAVVCDIGGTTSDVALLHDGIPRIDARGARVGSHRTMVEAVAMHTFGLGGDCEIRLAQTPDDPEFILGPRRLIPLSLLAHQHGECVHSALDEQLESPLPERHHGRFAIRALSITDEHADSLPPIQRNLYNEIHDTPIPLSSLLFTSTDSAALSHLLERGLISVSGLTPSDALHGLGRYDEWDSSAAQKGLVLFSRRRGRDGNIISDNPTTLAEHIVSSVERRSAEIVLQTVWQDEDKNADYVHHNLVQEVLDIRSGSHSSSSHISMSMDLQVPFIGLGASAFQYHRACEQLLNCRVVIPDDADVANAIGAVVGRIILRAELLVVEQESGVFMIVGSDETYATSSDAFGEAESRVRSSVERLCNDAGADDIEISVERTDKRATIESRSVLIESTIRATAIGRPKVSKET